MSLVSLSVIRCRWLSFLWYSFRHILWLLIRLMNFGAMFYVSFKNLTRVLPIVLRAPSFLLEVILMTGVGYRCMCPWKAKIPAHRTYTLPWLLSERSREDWAEYSLISGLTIKAVCDCSYAPRVQKRYFPVSKLMNASTLLWSLVCVAITLGSS